jgi:very-short-patch-repair endonuclease
MAEDPNLPVDPLLLQRARDMRHDPAPAEQKLWRCLRGRQLCGLKFRRQHVMGGYIADFYCHELALVIELDGDSHGERLEYDSRRTKVLERDGMTVVRFLNSDVYRFLDSVLNEIIKVSEGLHVKHAPSPQPSPEGRGSDSSPLPPGEG